MKSLKVAVVLALLAVPAGAEWTVTKTADKMTDKAVVVMTEEAAEGGALLKVQCDGKDFGMFLKTEAPVHSRLPSRAGFPFHVRGMWRLDSAKAEDIIFGATPTDTLIPVSTFRKPDGKAFFKKMVGAKRVMFQPEMAAGTVAVFTFPLAGLDVGALKACYP